MSKAHIGKSNKTTQQKLVKLLIKIRIIMWSQTVFDLKINKAGFGGKHQKVENFLVRQINASHLLVIKSLAKYAATAGCNETTSMIEVLLRSGFEPPTFRFTKQAAKPRRLITIPHCRDASNQATCIYKHRRIANRL